MVKIDLQLFTPNTFIMKRKIMFFIGVVLFSYITSCKKIEELLTFYVNDETTFTVENQFPVDIPFNIPTPDIESDSQEEFENNNTRANLVKNIYLNKLELSILSPEGTTFSFLESIHIFISTDDSNEIELAFKENIDEDTKKISMETSDSRLDKYVKSDTYDLRFKLVTDEVVLNDIELKAKMRYKVTADPF